MFLKIVTLAEGVSAGLFLAVYGVLAILSVIGLKYKIIITDKRDHECKCNMLQVSFELQL